MYKFEALKTSLGIALKKQATDMPKVTYDELWEKIVHQSEKFTYHNLDRVLEVLEFTDNRQLLLEDETLVAILMRNLCTLIYDKNSNSLSAHYAESYLKDVYKWKPEKASRVNKLIRFSSGIIETPDERDGFQERLVYDFRIFPLSVSWDKFCTNMHLLRQEYKSLTDKDFYTFQRAALLFLKNKERLYSTMYFKDALEEQTRKNIYRYYNVINIKLLEINSVGKKLNKRESTVF